MTVRLPRLVGYTPQWRIAELRASVEPVVWLQPPSGEAIAVPRSEILDDGTEGVR